MLIGKVLRGSVYTSEPDFLGFLAFVGENGAFVTCDML
jgi:hypothetical protein